MQGVDGNYLRMQGEALSRLQVGLQAEVLAQQVSAQTANDEALRRLREEVATMEASVSKERGPDSVGEWDSGRGGRGTGPGRNPSGAEDKRTSGEGEEIALEPGDRGTRIDLRV